MSTSWRVRAKMSMPFEHIKHRFAPLGMTKLFPSAGLVFFFVLHVIWHVPFPSSSIRSLFIDGPAGRLEALLNSRAETAWHAALICHPHPVYAGTIHNKVH